MYNLAFNNIACSQHFFSLGLSAVKVQRWTDITAKALHLARATIERCLSMRYFFDIRMTEGAIIQDFDGADLDGDSAALAMARVEARCIAADALKEGQLCPACSILVRDSTGRLMVEVSLFDAVAEIMTKLIR